jgi:hypothetical protein
MLHPMPSKILVTKKLDPSNVLSVVRRAYISGLPDGVRRHSGAKVHEAYPLLFRVLI